LSCRGDSRGSPPAAKAILHPFTSFLSRWPSLRESDLTGLRRQFLNSASDAVEKPLKVLQLAFQGVDLQLGHDTGEAGEKGQPARADRPPPRDSGPRHEDLRPAGESGNTQPTATTSPATTPAPPLPKSSLARHVPVCRDTRTREITGCAPCHRLPPQGDRSASVWHGRSPHEKTWAQRGSNLELASPRILDRFADCRVDRQHETPCGRISGKHKSRRDRHPTVRPSDLGPALHRAEAQNHRLVAFSCSFTCLAPAVGREADPAGNR